MEARIQAAEEVPKFFVVSTKTFCHSERSEESLFLFQRPNAGEIPRSARNDKIIGMTKLLTFSAARRIAEK